MIKEWKLINVTDIFEIKDGYYNKKPPIQAYNTQKKDLVPFLGATQNNNGITGFCLSEDVEKWDKVGEISDKDINKRFFKGNCIAVTNNGSVGHAYYQESKFTCSHDVSIWYLKSRELNKNLALFFIVIIQQTAEKFSYANKWRPKRMRQSKILVPFNEYGEIAYSEMEKSIENKVSQLKKVINIPEINIISNYTD